MTSLALADVSAAGATQSRSADSLNGFEVLPSARVDGGLIPSRSGGCSALRNGRSSVPAAHTAKVLFRCNQVASTPAPLSVDCAVEDAQVDPDPLTEDVHHAGGRASVLAATAIKSTAHAAAPPRRDVSTSPRSGGGIGEALRVAKHTESRSVAVAVVSAKLHGWLRKPPTPIPWAIRLLSSNVPAGSVEPRGRTAVCITSKLTGVPKTEAGVLQCHRCAKTTHFLAHGGLEHRWSTRDRGSTLSQNARDHHVELP